MFICNFLGLCFRGTFEKETFGNTGEQKVTCKELYYKSVLCIYKLCLYCKHTSLLRVAASQCLFKSR